MRTSLTSPTGLTTGARDGRDGWEVTMAAERARLVRLCRRFTGEADVVEDLAQETLLEAWRHGDSHGRKIHSWHGLMRHRWLDLALGHIGDLQ
ncbi:MAG: hypothetical protein HY332_09170 [Chloroflexi bacterium]|nr:hypothetical protein [Chloroflexota bacterium]